jgi:hypothetical protein
MGHVADMYKISSVYLKGRDHLGDVGEFGRHNWDNTKDIGGKARRKENIGKTKTYVGGQY